MARNEKEKTAQASRESEMEKTEGKEKAGGTDKKAVEETIREGRERAEVKREAQTGSLRDAEGAKKPQKYDVRFTLFPSDGPVKGVCSVTIGGEFAVKNVKLVEGSRGLFVAMPSYKSGEEYKDIFFPVTKEARQSMQDAVIAEFDNQMMIHKYDAHYGQPAPEPAMAGELSSNVIQ